MDMLETLHKRYGVVVEAGVPVMTAAAEANDKEKLAQGIRSFFGFVFVFC